MKKLCLLLTLVLIFTGCSKKETTVSVVHKVVEGVIEEINNGVLTIKTEDSTITVENTDARANDRGRNITIEYENEVLTDITIYGKAFHAEADKVLENMTLDEKIGQLFLLRYNENSATEVVEKYNAGGFVLFARDFENETPESILEEIALLQQKSKLPLLMAVDEEGGIVVRVSNLPAFRESAFLSPSELYEEGGFELIAKDAEEKAQLLKSIGLNVNLAPVADISTDKNDFINKRTVGLDAEGTSEYIKTVVSVMSENKIGSVLKHFPGYGNNKDTHTGIAIDERSYESILNNDIKPFVAGIESGADSILVSHNIVKSIDDKNPASLSPMAHNILRNVLGFDGVIMTDDLDMGAITEYTENKGSAVDAILAGNDMVICADYETQINAVKEAVSEGIITEEAINDAARRVIIWKIKLDII